MRTPRLALAVAALIILAAPGSGQKPIPAAADRELTGRVVDAKTGGPIAAAQVEIVGTNRGGITDDDGYFRVTFTAPPSQRIAVRAVSIGYFMVLREDVDVSAPTVVLDLGLLAGAEVWAPEPDIFITRFAGYLPRGDGRRANQDSPYGRPFWGDVLSPSTTWSVGLQH